MLSFNLSFSIYSKLFQIKWISCQQNGSIAEISDLLLGLGVHLHFHEECLSRSILPLTDFIER